MATDEIDITGIDRAELLAALYNGTRSFGMGLLQNIQQGMSRELAAQVLAQYEAHAAQAAEFQSDSIWFDWVCGRPIKVRLQGNVIKSADLYDRDAGEGACQRIVDQLRAKAVAR